MENIVYKGCNYSVDWQLPEALSENHPFDGKHYSSGPLIQDQRWRVDSPG